MPLGRPTTPGIRRNLASAPARDTATTRGIDPSSSMSDGLWSPFGLTANDHTLTVNLATGGLSVSVRDLSLPYYSLTLEATRTLDVQEQYGHHAYIRSHPNTDPRLHFFGNWQFQREVQLTPTWHETYSALRVTEGDGGSSLYYEQFPDFAINASHADAFGARLRSFGVPGRTLAATNWQYEPYDYLLRTRQSDFAILAGRYSPETIVDPVAMMFWCFKPTTGQATTYTSEYSYDERVDTDGLREVNPHSIISLEVDSVGHFVSFAPDAVAPPYRSYQLADGTGRILGIQLDQPVTYLDGNKPGGKVKTYLVSSIIDRTSPKGNTIEYRYEEHRLTEVQYPGHAGEAPRVVRYVYDATGALTRLIDALGNEYSIDYVEDTLDSDDNLVPRLKVARITDGEGNYFEYAYDHPESAVTVSFGNAQTRLGTIGYRYITDNSDTRQRYLISETVDVAKGHSGKQRIETQRRYSNDGRFLIDTTLDPLGNASRFEYNSFNQVAATIDPAGHRRDFRLDIQVTPTPQNPNRYDLTGVYESNVDGRGNQYQIERKAEYRSYDATTSHEVGDSAQSSHRLQSQTDERGHVWVHEYDDQANNAPLNPTTTTDPLGARTHWTFDAAGRVLQQTDGKGIVRSWTYNPHGQLTSATDANGNSRYWLYDEASGWLTEVTDALGAAPGDPGHTMRYERNSNGQTTRQTDAVKAVTEYRYYRNGRLHSIVRYAPNPQSIRFAYGPRGDLATVTDGLGRITAFQYDEAGRLFESYHDSPALPTLKLVLDPAGRIVSRIDASGRPTNFAYDSVDRLVQVQEPNWPDGQPTNQGKLVTFMYDDLGHRVGMTDSEFPNACSYEYDPAGNRVASTDHFGYALHQEYDARNGLVHLYDDSGLVDVRYLRDELGRVASVTDSDYLDPARNFQFFYADAMEVDNLYRITADNTGIETRFAYDSNRRLILCQHTYRGNPLASYTYAYRGDGLVERITGSHQGRYEYDGMKQLVAESDSGTRSAYDAAGNRLWRAPLALAPLDQNVYDRSNRLLATPPSGTTFAYETSGTLANRRISGVGQTNYIWDGGARLAGVDNGTQRIGYLYDFDGRLVQRIIADATGQSVTRFRYANGAILAQLDDQGNIIVLYTASHAGGLLRRRGSQPNPLPSNDPHSLFYLQDGTRSVTQLVDWDGTVHLGLDYDAWGLASPQAVLADDPFRYRGAYQDPQTGLTKFGARWYDASIGRWISPDPLLMQLPSTTADIFGQSEDLTNLYRYVGNRPLNLSDALGLQAGPPPWSTGWMIPSRAPWAMTAGIIVSGEAEWGVLGAGQSVQGSVGIGPTGAFASGVAYLAGGPAVEETRRTKTGQPTTGNIAPLGASVGFGIGLFFSNVMSIDQLRNIPVTCSLNLGVLAIQGGVNPAEDTFFFAITEGPSRGYSASCLPTTTVTWP